MGFCSWLPLQEKVANIAKAFEKNDRLRHIDSILNISRENSAPLEITGKTSRSAFNIPIFLSHSGDDEVVPFKYGLQLCHSLENFGFKVNWKCYEKGDRWIHEPQGVDDLVEFLNGDAGVES